MEEKPKLYIDIETEIELEIFFFFFGPKGRKTSPSFLFVSPAKLTPLRSYPQLPGIHMPFLLTGIIHLKASFPLCPRSFQFTAPHVEMCTVYCVELCNQQLHRITQPADSASFMEQACQGSEGGSRIKGYGSQVTLTIHSPPTTTKDLRALETQKRAADVHPWILSAKGELGEGAALCPEDRWMSHWFPSVFCLGFLETIGMDPRADQNVLWP